ncbi:DENN domain-containing protein 10-like [Patiria miniata]|uniref:UDENN domain-containing protein n=1 Tax=Patiria miniata TaxID=46514 RepID=A0A914B4I2_PATMI|nr:DENN domain-containing protein 10-like [Patiria miniata]
MAALIDLFAAGLMEKDVNSDVLWVWSYPVVTAKQRELIQRKGCLSTNNSAIVPYVYGQHNRQWFYIRTEEVNDAPALAKVKSFSLVLLTRDFNPEKYSLLSKILCQAYMTSGNPTSMLEHYLSVVTKGSCLSEDNGMFQVQDFDMRKAFAAASVKDVINKFEMESILIYTALLLKKRIAVYHSKVEDLLHFVRALPCLVWHRQNWSLLYPYMDLESEDEIQELKSTSSYVAGFTNEAIESRTDLFDLFVNIPSAEITVAPNAKEYFAMGKLHKDIAQVMVSSAQDEAVSNKQTIVDISNKTMELINNLKSLSDSGPDGDGAGKVSIEALRERKMPPATENFLFSLAAAEGLAQV